MKRFWIVYKDATCISGRVDCPESQFKIRFIEPNRDKISSWYLSTKVEDEDYTLDLQTLNQITI